MEKTIARPERADGHATRRRVKLCISYDGTNYSGWQRQKYDTTIQGEIEKYLTIMTCEDIFLHGAGRTDAGVHAKAMIAHFDTTSTISNEKFQRGLNSMLPGAIRILSAETCHPSFHSRFSATGKKYHYAMYTGTVLPPDIRFYTLHVTSKLDLTAINECLQFLKGTHDFTSFENTGSRDKESNSGRGAVRTIYNATLLQSEINRLAFEFVGDGFLKNMVRNMAGTLLEVGRGKLTTQEFQNILEITDRSMGGPTAPAHGLCLMEVYYGQSKL